MKTQRTDTHAPRNFDPAEYTEVGYFDNHPEEGGSWMDRSVSASEFVGNYVDRGRCDHCGAGPLRYGVVFLHGPSQRLVAVGTTCAERLNLGSRSEYDRKALLAQAIRERIRAEWMAQAPVNAELAAFIHAVSTTPYITYSDESDDATVTGHPFREAFPAVSGSTIAFLSDLDSKLHRYGNLSEKQVAAIAKIKTRNDEWLAQRAEQAESMQDVPALVEGRRVIEGTVLSTKWQDSDYGSTQKMLVKLDDGTKVYGSVPSAINVTGGERVTFTATIERSGDDQHFGFYKRPSKATIVA